MTRSTAIAAVGLAFFLLLAASASAAPPTISYSIEGISGTNGWYRGSAYGDNVLLHWSVSGGPGTCLAAVAIPGPTTGTTQSCSATNSSGTVTLTTTAIKIDATPPTGVTASFSRKPDFNGWYNHPVTISWSGTDATSGIAGCSSVTYRSPDGPAAAINGGCTDLAGNSAILAAQLAYDGTAPSLGKVTEQSTPGANVLRWISSSASDRVVVRRAIRGSKAHRTVFDGSSAEFADQKIRPGAQYVYSVQSFDQAGNSSHVVTLAGLPKVLTLTKTRYVPRAAPNPILRWGRLRSAGYYNVQLFRGSKRIYAAWPTANHLSLPQAWRWSGHRFRLTPGRYRWYVWAGLGARILARYRSVGSATFIVPRS